MAPQKGRYTVSEIKKKKKKSTALYNIGPKGTVLCRVTRAIAGTVYIQWGMGWAFLAASLLLISCRVQDRGFEGMEFPGYIF